MNTRLVTVSEEQLVSELWARDVRFLMGEQISQHPLLDSATLIQSLADSRDARVRMALIPLFLRHPDFFGDAKKADETLSSQPSQLYLRPRRAQQNQSHPRLPLSRAFLISTSY